MGMLYVGPKQSFFELRQFVQPRALLVFAGISGGATLVAFLGRSSKAGSKVVDSSK
jgi:cysteine synthase